MPFVGHVLSSFRVGHKALIPGSAATGNFSFFFDLARCPMCSRFLFFVLFASRCTAQQPAVSDRDMPKMQHAHTHDEFMQGGMHHAVAQRVTLDAKSDQTSHVINLRIGPMHLAANTS